MHKVVVKGETYTLNLTIGALEELERKGHSFADVLTPEAYGSILIKDFLVAAGGVDADVVSSLPGKELITFIKPIMAELREQFDVGDDAAGPAEGTPAPGE